MRKNYSFSMRSLLTALVFLFAFSPAWAQTYSLVTDVASLDADDEIIITSGTTSGYALSTTQNSNNRAAVAISFSDGKIVNPDAAVQVLTLGKEGDNYTLYTGSGYLYAAGNGQGNNYLRTQTTLDDNGKWSISITSDGVATVKAQGSNTVNWLRYNNSNKVFSCYASGQNDIYIYKKVVSSDPLMYASPAELNFFVATGTASDAQTVTLTLENMDASTVSYSLTGDDFAVTKVSDTEYSVVFNAPATEGDYEDELSFTTTVEGVDPVTVALKGTAIKEGDIVEHFNSTTVTVTKYDSGSSYSTEGNSDGHDFTWTPSGSVYLGKDFVRFGTTSATGSLTSSDFLAEIPEGTPFTVKVRVAKWGSDAVSFVVSYGTEKQTYTSLEKSVSSTATYNVADFEIVECEFTKNESTDFTIATTSKRALVDQIDVFYEKGPSLSVSPASYDFGKFYVDEVAAEWSLVELTATPSNFSGEVTYTYALSGEGFAFDDDAAPAKVLFAATTEGSFAGTLTVTATYGEEAASASVALTAVVETRPVPSMTASTDALEFKTPVGTKAKNTVTLTVENLTSAVAYALSGDDADLFAVAAEADVYTVTFAAPATIGTYSATLTFSADGVEPVAVSLTGIAQELPNELWERFECESGQDKYNTSTAFNTTGYDFDWTDDGSSKSGRYCVKVAGTLTSPNLLAIVPAGVEFTVVAYAADWKSSATANPENAHLQVTYNGVSYDSAMQDAVAAGQSYAASDFANPVRFTFTKVDGVEEISFGVLGGFGRLVIDDIVVEFGGVNVVSTFPEADATGVVLSQTDRMSITFNKEVASVDAEKIAVSPEDWSAAADRCVEVVETDGNTVVFRVNSVNTYLTSYNQQYTVSFAADAVLFVDGASSPAYAWSFTTQSISTGLQLGATDGLLYDGRQVIAAGDALIEVYNLAGACVAARYGNVDFTGMAAGVYVVRCGSEVLKVVKR